MAWSDDSGELFISSLKSRGMYPFSRSIDSVNDEHVVHDGKSLLMLSSNNYLSLARNAEVIEATQKAIAVWGVGCTGSRFLNGNFAIHEDLEDDLAAFLGYESCLIYPSGYMANQGTIQALVGPGDFILTSKYNHTCIAEGCQLSRATIIEFDHADLDDLRAKLAQLPENSQKLVVIDAVFSMTGELARLDEMSVIAREFGALLYADDAHGLGVLGRGGRGTADHFGVKPDILMGTFSKSLGSQGGFICANKKLTDWVQLKARTFMFSAALSPANTQAAKTSLEILTRNPQYAQQVREKAKLLNDELAAFGIPTYGQNSAIVAVKIGNDRKAMEITNTLFNRGYFVCPVVYPAVPPRQAMIRCSVTLGMQNDDLRRFAAEFKQAFDNAHSSKGAVFAAFYAGRPNEQILSNLKARDLG